MQTAVYIGLDIGSVSAKLAAIFSPPQSLGPQNSLLVAAAEPDHFRAIPDGLLPANDLSILISDYRRIEGSPVQAALDLLADFYARVPESLVTGMRVTGSGGRLLAEALGIRHENEFKALAQAIALLHPTTRTVFELGGGTSKYLRLEPDPSGRNGHLRILDYSTNGDCAAGTGSFLDQQASRLQYHVEEIGKVAGGAKCAACIAGRCSVFAKSDMIHAQQKGYGTDEILKGLCDAVARNFKSSIVKGRPAVPPVGLIGAVAQNQGVAAALQEAFHLAPGDLQVSPLHSWLGAIGAALLEQQSRQPHSFRRLQQLDRRPAEKNVPHSPPLSMENVLLLRGRVKPYELPARRNGRIPAYLGIDVGSVSTNLAVIDESGRLMHEIYLRTIGRPIEIVHEGLREIEEKLGDWLDIRGAGTTGSGRELIGELIGADTVNDEITAHKTGALYVNETMVGETVDTIFEIGGQDSKFISIERGIVVDFAMNEACAAGTGSFLEEQAERLGISIKDEFARLALSSKTPARLGERCTVFMDSDVTALMHRGADVCDLTAGLAYSVALNYLNRVVRGRKIGDAIYFQGGTAYNDAVAAAFSRLLGKRIVVPPYNGVIGAIGMALLAREKAHATGRPSTFRGYDLSRTRFQTRDFVCRACSNYCDMKEITIGGQKTYWGDKCSDKFRKRSRTDRQPVIEDLIEFYRHALLDGYAVPSGADHRPRVGIPRSMFFFDRFPFWRAYLDSLGFDVILSGETDRQIAAQGIELSVAEPCFPVQVAHGHVKELLNAGVDRILLPNVMDSEAPPSNVASHLCPWNQTLPHVIRAAPGLSDSVALYLSPTLHFRLGERHVKERLAAAFAPLGVSRRQSDEAVDEAYFAQRAFRDRLLEAGRRALAILEQTGEPAVLLVGRPYNLYDLNLNCDIPRKLRALYGVNVVPMDFLPVDLAPVDEINANMFWNSGRRILAAGQLAGQLPNFHVLYITNFKCGPDSFVKHFMRQAVGSPFLVLQFDGHGNDAGYLTRCEAYLDSKGILRCYTASPSQQTAPLPETLSLAKKCGSLQ
jgi:predicted CoA-substrate-specific enzyme activase